MNIWPPYFPFFLSSGQEAWVNLRDKRIKEKEYNKRRSILVSTHVTNGYGKQRHTCVSWRGVFTLSLSLYRYIKISIFISFISYHSFHSIIVYLLCCFFFSFSSPLIPSLSLSHLKKPFASTFHSIALSSAYRHLLSIISLLHLLFAPFPFFSLFPPFFHVSSSSPHHFPLSLSISSSVLFFSHLFLSFHFPTYHWCDI